jgi:methionyl-tRNA formyltransferase
MFDTVILLTGPIERTVLPSALLGHNPGLTVLPIERASELASLSEAVLKRSRLVAFVTPVIVPQSILTAIGYGAFNFHPGPPSYPGWAPAHFALYDQAADFGATVHAMVEQVDAGPIIEFASFPIPPHTTVLGLEGLAYAHLALLFWRMAKWLATDCDPPPTLPVAWSNRKYSRQNYRAMCEIPLNISKGELERRLKVFGDNYFGVAPSIRLHGVEFRAVIQPQAVSELETLGRN